MQDARKADASVIDPRAGIELRTWRRQGRLSRKEGARQLGISERMLAYYESGEYEVPRTVIFAVRHLSGAGSSEKSFGRERWVNAVDALLRYGRGEPVVGQLLKQRMLNDLADVLELAQRGPDPRTALTDPSLFQALREASTRMHLAGLFTLPGFTPEKLRDRAVRLEQIRQRTPEEVEVFMHGMGR